MKHILSFSAAMLFTVSLFAQGEMDALRFSGNDLTGTARGMAMSGAFGALGGDITGISTNPAGIGVYRSSEVVTTLNFENVSSKTEFTNNKFKFNFDNVAYVGYFPTGTDGLKAFQFGFSYNRLKNFDRKYGTAGNNLNSSLTDYMALDANRLGLQEGHIGMDIDGKNDPFLGGGWLPIFGYNGYLINPPMSSLNGTQITGDEYKTILHDGEILSNDLLVEEKGSIAAYDFTLGANVSDILSLGMTLTVTDIQYKMYSSYIEEPNGGGLFELENWLETNGTGFGVKLGAILRPIDALRLGVAYHSPTWYNMSDTYSAKLYHENLYDPGEETPASSHSSGEYRPLYYPDAGWESINSGSHVFDYKLQTPYKWVFSLAGVIENWAILSLDYEIKDYSGMDFSAADGLDINYKNDNEIIDMHYRNASTVKLGAEFRVTPQFSIRGGFAWMQNPLEKEFKAQRGNDSKLETHIAGSVPHYLLDDDAYYYTFGFGYRFTPQFYLDIASVVKTQDSDLYAFPVVGGDIMPQATAFSTKTFKGLITLGYKF